MFTSKLSSHKVKFDRDSGFHRELHQRVHEYFNSRKITTGASIVYWVKVTSLLIGYTAVGCLIYVNPVPTVTLGLYSLMGVLAVLIGLNMGHDAAHGSLSKRKFVNQLGLLAFDLVGANAYMWQNRHVHAHHPFPNVIDLDSDIQQTALVRIFPGDSLRSWQRFQHYYMPLLYLFYIPYWLFYRDIRDFFRPSIGAWKSKGHKPGQIVRLILAKLFFLYYTLVFPLLFAPVSKATILTGFLLMLICASITVSIALISTHVGEHSKFPEPEQSDQFQHSWAAHQVITTTDFATGNFFITQAFGAFNHHAVHHLFPHICHIHYPELTPILEEVAAKYGIPYTCERKWTRSALSHWRLLRSRSKLIDDAIPAAS
ncbi:MAG: acyl-CoA desaturase [Flavobacteriales bacterium]|nr:acyl-CoA desaturase [Flavobacteriales bacterium]